MPARKLPPHNELLKMYMNGWSYTALSKKYNVTKNNVYHTLKRGCEREGRSWPIQTESQRVRKIYKGVKAGTVDATLIGLVLTEHLAQNGLSVAEFADANDLHRTYIYLLRAGKVDRMRPGYAVKLLQAIGEPVPRELLARAS